MKDKAINIVETQAEELLKMLLIPAKIAVSEEEEGRISVSIESEDSSILIGYHGENLEALQLILSFLVSKKIGEFKKITVNVGDYRERREEKLKELALRAKEEALQKNGDVVLANLSGNERRIIHLLFQEDEEVMSESEGEGSSRQLIVKPRKSA